MPAVALYRQLMGAVGLAYLLDDEFTDKRPAGGINATPAVPGPGTRTVVDTNSKLSLAGGVLDFATGGVGVGNPGIWYPSVTRTAGRVLIAKSFTPANTSIQIDIGWDSNQSGGIVDAVRFLASGTLKILENTAVAITLGSYVGATAYDVAISQRNSGFWAFIKGGTFANWTLLWVSTASTGNLFPAVGSAAGTVNIATCDGLRVPQSLYIPTLWYDSFTRANGALSSSESVGPDGQGIPSLAWTGATWAIATNVVANTPALGADVVVNGAFAADTDWSKGAGWTISGGVGVATAASSDITATVAPLTQEVWYQTEFTLGGFTGGTARVKLGTASFPTHGANGTYTETGRATSTALAVTAAAATLNVDNFSAKSLTLSELIVSLNTVETADVHARVAVTLDGALLGKQAGLCLNLDSAASPANFILAYLDGRGNAVLDECVAGVYTNKISAAVTYSAGEILYVIRRGTSAWLFYKNAQVGTVQTMTANVGTIFGLFSTSSLCSLDNFEIWPDGGRGEHAELSLM